MSEQNKETIKELKSLVSNLQVITKAMSDNYAVLSKIVIQELLILFFLFILLLIYGRIVNNSFYVLPCLAILSILLFLLSMIGYKLVKLGAKHKEYFTEGKHIIKTMADKAEWTTFKKRLIYNGNDAEVSNSVNDFFIVSEKTWSPSRTEKRYFISLVASLPMVILSTLLIIAIKVIFGL